MNECECMNSNMLQIVMVVMVYAFLKEEGVQKSKSPFSKTDENKDAVRKQRREMVSVCLEKSR